MLFVGSVKGGGGEEEEERGEEGEGEEHPSDAWLGAIARGTMSTYMTNILQIPSLSQPAACQLATDICKSVPITDVMECLALVIFSLFV